MTHSLRVLCIVIALVLASVGRTFAAPVLWSDDFSPQNKQLWHEVFNSVYVDPDSPCSNSKEDMHWRYENGTIGVVINQSQPCTLVVIPSQLHNFDSRAYTLELTLHITDPLMDRNLLLRWQDEQSTLGFHLFGQAIDPQKKVDGQVMSFGKTLRYEFKPDTTYQFRIEYDVSLLTAQMYIDDQFIGEFAEQPNDPQVAIGPPGLQASVGDVRTSEAWFDDFRILDNQQTTLLSIPLIKQDDVRWAKEVYDSAPHWSTQHTIARWGCALTSAVMLLDFYGIKTFSDGSLITPSTLNAWLIQQPDGYFGTGLVNWRAISRLTKERSKQLGTPSLEYYPATPRDKLGWVRGEITANRPVILAQPEHFVLVHGLGPGRGDISLRDPLFEAQSLQQYNNTFLSARQFIPSYTDLSAITIVTKDGVRVGIKKNESEVNMVEYAEPDFSSPPSRWNVYDLAKPEPGEYSLEISSEGSLLQPLFIAVYNQDGAVTTQTLSNASGRRHINLTFMSAAEPPKIYAQKNPLFLTPEILARSVADQSLASPYLVGEILRMQAGMLQAETLETAQSWLRKFTMYLKLWRENSWISPTTAQSLALLAQEWLLDRFP